MSLNLTLINNEVTYELSVEEQTANANRIAAQAAAAESQTAKTIAETKASESASSAAASLAAKDIAETKAGEALASASNASSSAITATTKASEAAASANTAASANLEVGKVFKSTIVTSSGFPFYAIKALEIKECSDPTIFLRTGVLKELYVVFLRKKGVTGATSSILQIGEKIGTSVGASLNLFASATLTTDGVGIETIELSGTGIKLNLTIDWNLVNVWATYTTQIPINSDYLYRRALFFSTIKNLSLSGKTVVCFGDSTTEDFNYPASIATITGATVHKIGFGGARMARTPNANYNELSMYRIAQSVASQNFTAMQTAINNLIALGDNNSVAFNLLTSINFNNVDIVTIWFGTNDFSAGDVTIGSIGSELDTSIIGAINIVIRELCTTYKNLKILFITPTHRLFNGADNSDSDLVAMNGIFLIEYVDAIKTCANYNHLPVLDMYREGGFNKFNRSRYFVDGVHFNQIGIDHLAQMFSAKLTSLFKFS